MDVNLKIRLVYDHFQAGNLRQAESVCKDILKDNADNAYLWDFLGIIYSRIQDYDSAADCFKKAVHLKPDSAETLCNLASVLVKKEQLDEAAGYYQKAFELNPALHDALFKLAVILQKKGDIDAAITHYIKVLNHDPTSVPAYFNLGTAYQEKKRPDDAIACYRKVLELRPQFADAYYKLSSVLLEIGRTDEAQFYYLKWKQITKEGNEVLSAQRSPGAASGGHLDNIKTAWQKCMSSLPVIYLNESEVLAAREDYRNQLLDLHTIVSLSDPKDIGNVMEYIGVHAPFYLTYQGLNDRELQQVYGKVACKVMGSRYREWTARPPMPPHPPGQPLRIGFVSGYFYYHSVWKIPIKGWIENIDRDRFSLYGYYTGTKKDAITEIARRSFDRFTEGISSFDALCRIIRDDNLQVLIYPEIGMDPLTVKLATLRLAPVQCVSWGHPETSGFPTIDYFLSSELMEPQEAADDHYTERLIRLPNLSVYYTPTEGSPAAMNREDFGLRPKSALYHCCQALYKFLPQYDEIFPRIALETGDCQFIFSSYPFVTETLDKFHLRMDKAFKRYNLESHDHVEFAPLLNPAQYQALNKLSDIFLDIIGWSGCNSVLEALESNLPVITLPSQLMRGREAFAILSMMGVHETIATSLNEYISLAVELGRDREKRKQISYKIASAKSLVYRDKSCIKGLEEFLLKAVRDEYERDTTGIKRGY